MNGKLSSALAIFLALVPSAFAGGDPPPLTRA